MKAFRHTIAAGVLLILAGCTTQGDIQSPVPVEDRGAVQTAPQTGTGIGSGAEARGVDVGGGFQGGPLDAPEGSPLAQRVIYFDFDSNAIRPEFHEVLRAHGAYLADNPQTRLSVEGHTDERGSPSYNLALGERRAEAVKKVLVLNGASPDQIEVVSYGEEKPAVFGSTEEAWAKNRRAELNYQR